MVERNGREEETERGRDRERKRPKELGITQVPHSLLALVTFDTCVA